MSNKNILAAFLWLLSPAALGAVAPVELMKSAVELVCSAKSRSDLMLLGSKLPGMGGAKYHTSQKKMVNGRRWLIHLPDGMFSVDWLAPRGLLHHIRIKYSREQHDLVIAVLDSRCHLKAAKQLRYDEQGKAEWLDELDETFVPVHSQPLNPPVPRNTDPGGVSVALIDTGVNYLLPAINKRLARDSKGQLLGYDYWDLDDRPFDFDPAKSIFFPSFHGTQIASLLLQAPVVRLLPYRYPRSEMALMAKLIEHAALHQVRLLNVSLTSFHREDWLPFAEAARNNPQMLFIVAAGNKRRDLDRRPVYPAALALANLITVTAATKDGHLARGMNWGAHSVDLMVPGEDITVTDYDGQTLSVSGTSYATARITALAACLLAEHPDWSAAQLKAAIFALAQAPASAGYVNQGFIPDQVLQNQNCNLI